MIDLINQFRHLDYRLYRFFHDATNEIYYLYDLYIFFARFGVVIIALSSIYLIMKKKVSALFCAFLAVAYSAMVDLMIMLIWKRPRPFVSHEGEFPTPITEGLRVDSVSFPSAHTYMAFAVATSIWLYGHKRLGAALYLVALCVAVSRIGAGLHYPSDIIAGALLGIFSGYMAYFTIQKNQHIWREDGD
jgi:undecaprenyl-diphosphatase